MAEDNTGTNFFSIVITILLIIFFPIGIIVLIVRTVSKTRSEHIEGNYTKASTGRVKTETSIMQSTELERYNELYKKGILTKEEFEKKKIEIFNRKGVK